MLAVLVGVAGIPMDRAAQQKALITELKHKPRGLVRPERKYSVAELEEFQRNKGARIEFLDDLSAAMATSPKFRQSHGLASFASLPTTPGDATKEDGSIQYPGMPGAKKLKVESMPLPAGVSASEMEKAMSGGTPPPAKASDGTPLPAGVSASEMEKATSGGTPAAAPSGRADTTAAPSGRSDNTVPGATGGATDGSGRIVRGVDPKKLQIDGNVQRCGFSWDDAAAKCGSPCPMALQSECDINAPKVGVNSSWINHNYSCFADLPPCDPAKPKGNCYSRKEAIMDQFCTQICNMAHGYCNPDQCICDESEYDAASPIEDKPLLILPGKMAEKSHDLINRVKLNAATRMGLPDCLWRPGRGQGDLNCTTEKPYECMDTAKCSSFNFFEDDACPNSCIHTVLLKNAPYYALWRPGPLSPPFSDGDSIPHYEHENMAGQLAFTRKASGGSVLMSPFCKSKLNQFVGVSMHSPKYEPKARRLINSCERVGVCCKTTTLPPDAFGPDAPEGSEAFRFRTIALKPAFILSQLKATQLPVVFMDVDLELHKFPELFMPGSWPDDDRDVAMFNYWGNETNLTSRKTPNTGSGVAFFNQTYKAKKLLIAWAEAMAYGPNKRAPDDQVLDLLLVDGGWIKRASFGWLPAAYLRTVPAYYRGVDPVIDHDHGNPPGLLKHSEAKPMLPPVTSTEMVSVLAKAGADTVNCIEVTDNIDDGWCSRNCNTRIAGACPVQYCLCDWDNEWTVEDEEWGEGWDLTTLGIANETGAAGTGVPVPEFTATSLDPAGAVPLSKADVRRLAREDARMQRDEARRQAPPREQTPAVAAAAAAAAAAVEAAAAAASVQGVAPVPVAVAPAAVAVAPTPVPLVPAATAAVPAVPAVPVVPVMPAVPTVPVVPAAEVAAAPTPVPAAAVAAEVAAAAAVEAAAAARQAPAPTVAAVAPAAVPAGPTPEPAARAADEEAAAVWAAAAAAGTCEGNDCADSGVIDETARQMKRQRMPAAEAKAERAKAKADRAKAAAKIRSTRNKAIAKIKATTAKAKAKIKAKVKAAPPSEPCPGHPNILRKSKACRDKMSAKGGSGGSGGKRGGGAPALADWQKNEASVLQP